MKRSLQDTNALSYCLKGEPKVVARAGEYLAAFGKLDFSIIIYYEVRRGLVYAGATRKLAQFEALANISHVWELDRRSAQEAADICADLWRRGEPLDDADILIAGVSRSNGLVLITDNARHFGRIPGLQVESWLK